jgi:dihydrofolate reductase
MGKLIYSMNVSLDGYVNSPEGSLDWVNINEEVHGWFNDRARESAATIYGRRMYDVMTAYWPTAAQNPDVSPVELEFAEIWNATPKVVFSHSLQSADFGFRLVTGDVGDVLAGLRAEFDGAIDVSGPNIAGQFIERGLVDEYALVVQPVILGGGTPFFPKGVRPIGLRLIDTRTFDSGAVYLGYAAR